MFSVPPPDVLAQGILSGILMGFGGVTALGCTIGQGISGFSTLALGSIITFVAIVAGVGVATAFALQAFQKNLLYYYSPSQIQAGEAPDARVFRVGGLVENGSLKREPGSLEVRFTLTDFSNTVGVSYTGILPDLFREGQGECMGRMNDGGRGNPVIFLL